MAMTKVEAAKLTQDMMLRGVIETIVTESMILELLPFMEVTGTAVTYNRETTLPATSFFDVGDTAVDSKSFDGLRKIIGTGPRSITMGTNGAALTLDKLDEVIDLVKPGRPEALLMSKRSRRKLSS